MACTSWNDKSQAIEAELREKYNVLDRDGSIQDWLVMNAAMVEAVNERPEGFVYGCPQEFVLAHGREFKRAPLPDDIEPGEPKMCFQNAYKLVDTHDRFMYVEGYGQSVIPVDHAWAATPAGIVVDPTWIEPPPEPYEHTYFGVPFNFDFVERVTSSRGLYGVLDDWQNDFPLLRGEYDQDEWGLVVDAMAKRDTEAQR